MKRLLAVTSLLLVLAGCGGTEPSDGTGAAGTLKLISGDGQIDTAGAILSQSAVVEVRNPSGRPVSGVEVVFGLPDCLCAVGARADTSETFMASAAVITNSKGQASAQIRLLSQPSVARFPVSVPTLELTDTFEFTVRPGNGVQVYIQQRDSAVYLGGSFVVTAAVLDQWGNPRDDPVVLTTPNPAIVELNPDGRVTGRAYGQARIIASGSGFTDATNVGVLPTGTIAVALFAAPSNVAVAGLDGSGFHTVVESGVYGGGASSWSPDGERLAYHFSGSAGSPSLWITDLAGNTRKLISQHPASFNEEAFPRFSRDGVWIYFQGITFTVNPGEIWRIHPDGTGLEMVGQPGSSTEADYYPDPSPDGTRVVFATTRGQQGFRIRVRTLATGVEADLGISGLVPRWSPAGDWIAYHGDPDAGDGGIYLIRPNGTEGHSIADGRSYQLESVEWSPDGAWVIGRTPGGLELVGVNDTLSVPIPSSAYWMFPSWLR